MVVTETLGPMALLLNVQLTKNTEFEITYHTQGYQISISVYFSDSKNK